MLCRGILYIIMLFSKETNKFSIKNDEGVMYIQQIVIFVLNYLVWYVVIQCHVQ